MKYRLVLTAIVVGLLGLVSAFTYAQNLPAVTGTPAASSVIQQDIFVRGGPGRDYLPVGKLLAGDRVRPLSRNSQGDWVLIVYGKSFGWIRRDLAFWVENIDTLPVLDVANLTPSPVLPTTPTLTPLLLPTDTPAGNWVQLNGDAQSGFVRAGPGRTYLRLGQLLTGDSVIPVSRSADGSWIMIRFGDGFGWVARNLVLWVDNLDVLPVIALENLTPSATFTATNTPTVTLTSTSTSTPSATATPSFTPTITPSATDTAIPTSTPTATASETPVPTLTATWTATLVPSATDTAIPTSTPTAMPSETPVPTLTATWTATLAPSATDTAIPTSTPTATASETPLPTVEPTNTFTATAVPSEIPTVVEAAIVPSATVEVSPTVTASVTSTVTIIPATYTATVTASLTFTVTPVPPTDTVVPSSTPTASATSVTIPSATRTQPLPTEAVSSATQLLSPTATATSPQSVVGGINSSTTTPVAPTTGAPPSNSGVAPEVLIAAVVLLAILAYAVLYWRGISGSERYVSGFVVDTCPVCGRGHLIVEARQERLFGVPRSRHSVRCTDCRSVLREVSPQHWRYAVDPIENPDLYQRLNGQIIDEQTLIDLAHNVRPLTPSTGTTQSATPPDFIDDDL